MNKALLSILTVVMFLGTIARAEESRVDIEVFKKDLREALQAASIRTDVKVFCGDEGQRFAAKMAASLRETKVIVPDQKTNAATLAQLEKSAQSYEGLCEKSIKKAYDSGLTESEIQKLLDEK